MRRMGSLLLVLLTAAAAQALSTATTEAELVWSPAVPDVTATSLGTVTLVAGAVTVACNMTLRGFVNDFPTAASSTGALASGSTAGCTTGLSLTPEFTRPDLWLSTYRTYTGVLPYPSGAVTLFKSVQLLARVGATVVCRYIGDVTANWALRGASPNSLGLLTLSAASMPLVAQAGVCPRTAAFRGAFSVSPAATLTSVAAPPVLPVQHHLVGINATQGYQFINQTGGPVEVVSIVLDNGAAQGISTDPDPIVGLPATVGAGGTYNFTLRYVPLAGSTADDTVASTVVVNVRDAGGALVEYKAKVYGDP